jgi:hypothetical protein
MGIMPLGSGLAAGVSTVMVVPARYTIVQLAFDVASMRDVTLLSYQTAEKPRRVAVHAWNEPAGRWTEANLESLRAMLMGPPPVRTLLVGRDGEAPPEIERFCSAGRDVVRIGDAGIVPMLNAFHNVLRFSTQEWQWLSRRYGFELKDLNESRRRYGRYGQPGTQAPARDRPSSRSGRLSAGPAQPSVSGPAARRPRVEMPQALVSGARTAETAAENPAGTVPPARPTIRVEPEAAVEPAPPPPPASAEIPAATPSPPPAPRAPEDK